MNISLALATIIVLGMLAQWIAWKFRIPSLLLLLVFGILIGPVLGLLPPEFLAGKMIFPLISIAVAIILFEGGLELRFKELAHVGRVVNSLVTIGAIISWVLTAFAAHWLLDFSWPLSILLGAILIVTGPTVIGPLLRHMRPTGKVASALKWEGIIIDPLGVMLAVLVFEAILIGGLEEAIIPSAIGVLKTLFIGTLIGSLSGLIIASLLKRYWLPDFLQSPFVLMMIVIAYVISNNFQTESGLLSATVMGMIIANQKTVSIKRIAEFKESLRIILVSAIFIILAASMRREDITEVHASTFLFVAILIVVIRPIVVTISSIGSSLSWKERLLVAWMAPRGIVAAAMAGIFAYDLSVAGYADARQLVPITFFTIIGTVSIYSLTSPWLARVLGVARPNPQGVLIVGSHFWARLLAQALKKEDVQVLLTDTNYVNIWEARKMDLAAEEKNVLLQSDVEDLDLTGLGYILALTANNEVNSLAAARFSGFFGAAHLFQLTTEKDSQLNGQKSKTQDHLQGRFLFSAQATYNEITGLFQKGATIERAVISKNFDYTRFQNHHQNRAIPLFLISPAKQLTPFTVDKPPALKAEHILVFIAPPSPVPSS